MNIMTNIAAIDPMTVYADSADALAYLEAFFSCTTTLLQMLAEESQAQGVEMAGMTCYCVESDVTAWQRKKRWESAALLVKLFHRLCSISLTWTHNLLNNFLYELASLQRLTMDIADPQWLD